MHLDTRQDCIEGMVEPSGITCTYTVTKAVNTHLEIKPSQPITGLAAEMLVGRNPQSVG
ncbi:MAG: hypothetical protein ACPGIA_07270 [Luteolibacter sp.]